VKSYGDRELVFDSDVLGILKIDEEDVRWVRTAKPVRVGFETEERDHGLLVRRPGVEVIEDRIEVREGRVMRRDGGEEIAPVERVVAVAKAADSEWDNWSGKLSAGLNLREGNTQQLDYNARVDLERITAISRLELDYLGNYGEADGIEFANNHRVDFNWDRYLTRRFFVRPLAGSYFRDPFQNIDHRGQIGGGLGYDLIDTPETHWRVGGGPGYQYTAFRTVPVGRASDQSSVAAFLTSNFETELNERVDFISEYQMALTRRDAGLYAHQFENGLSIELTDDLDFDVSLIWNHIQQPARRADGTLPQRDDLRLMFMLGLEL